MKFNFDNTSVLRIGYSHYTCLPIQWVRDLGVRKGTELQISMDEEKRLIIEVVREEHDRTDN